MTRKGRFDPKFPPGMIALRDNQAKMFARHL